MTAGRVRVPFEKVNVLTRRPWKAVRNLAQPHQHGAATIRGTLLSFETMPAVRDVRAIIGVGEASVRILVEGKAAILVKNSHRGDLMDFPYVELSTGTDWRAEYVFNLTAYRHKRFEAPSTIPAQRLEADVAAAMREKHDDDNRDPEDW